MIIASNHCEGLYNTLHRNRLHCHGQWRFDQKAKVPLKMGFEHMHRFAVNSIVQLQRFSANKPHRSPSLSQYTACPGQPDSGAKIFRYQSWPRSDIQAQVQRLAWRKLECDSKFFHSRPGSGGQKLSRVLS